MPHDNGVPIDMINFGPASLGDVGSDHVNISGLGPVADAADALEQIEHGFLASVGHRPLPPDNLAEKKELLAAIFRHSYLDSSRRNSDCRRNQVSDLSRRAPFNAQLAMCAQLNAPVSADHLPRLERRAGGYLDRQDVRATDLVMVHYVRVACRDLPVIPDVFVNIGAVLACVSATAPKKTEKQRQGHARAQIGMSPPSQIAQGRQRLPG
jgi:hypothetical protein